MTAQICAAGRRNRASLLCRAHCKQPWHALPSAQSRYRARPAPTPGCMLLDRPFPLTGTGGPPERLRHALSKMLGPEIQVQSLEPAPPGFNARFDARGKRYAYTLDLGREPDPLSARYAWHVPHKLDLDLMAGLAPLLVGVHDFAGFQSTGGHHRDSTVCTLHSAQLSHGGTIAPCDAQHLWRIVFDGYGFLYRMVRNMTGTLVEIARGRFPKDFLETSLNSPGPFRGHCAPAHGLVLEKVYYDE